LAIAAFGRGDAGRRIGVVRGAEHELIAEGRGCDIATAVPADGDRAIVVRLCSGADGRCIACIRIGALPEGGGVVADRRRELADRR
jgi:hypothetical protein